MLLDGFHTNAQEVRGLFVGFPFGDELKHFGFPGRELVSMPPLIDGEGF
jgi:hypothetical protein